jgi:arylformamidase
MKPLFLSYFLDENTPIYGGIQNTIKFNPTSSILNGDTANNLSLSFPNHIGTHIDFPYHFSSFGKKCKDYSAEFWIFKKIGFIECQVNNIINEILLLPSDIEILILKTGFGKKRGTDEYWQCQPVITANHANLFKKKFPNLRLFGFDLISLTSKLDKFEGKKAHESFLIENNILLLEDMNLELYNNNTKPSFILVTPLQIGISDGVPCTVIAF